MKILSIILTLLLIASPAFAVSRDIRLSDSSGNVLGVNPDGTISITGSGTFTSASFDTVSTDALTVSGDTVINTVSADSVTLGTASNDTTLIGGQIDWTDGNVIYVPLDGDIEKYVDAVSDYDTLVLGTGTYTITSQIDIAKHLNIRGQGVNQTFVSADATTGIVLFDIVSSDVTIQDLTLSNQSTTGGATAVKFDGSGGTVLKGSRLENVDIIAAQSDTTPTAIQFIDSNGTVRNVNIDLEMEAGGSGTGNAFFVQNNSTAEEATVVDAYSVDLNADFATTSICSGFRVKDNSATQDITFNLHNSKSVVNNSEGQGVAGSAISGTDAFFFAENTTFSGNLADIFTTTSATMTIRDCVLVNGTASGDVTYSGTEVTDKVSADIVSVQTLYVSGITTISDDLLPAEDNAVSLGSASKTWSAVHIAGGTIYLGDATLTADGTDITAGVGSTFAMTKVVSLDSISNDTSIALYPNSDTDDYVIFETIGNKPIIAGIGNDLHLSTDSTKVIVDKILQAEDFYSGDGTAGMTGTCNDGTNLTVKDGLITACS